MSSARGVFSLAVFGLACALFGALAAYYLVPVRLVGAIPSADVSMPTLVGQSLPPLPFISRDGEKRMPWLGKSPVSLMVVFRQGCQFCEQVAPKWVALSKEFNAVGSIQAISLDSLEIAEQWMRMHGLGGVSVYSPIDPSILRSEWSLRGTPLTLVVRQNGVVLFEKYGFLTENSLEIIRDHIRSALASTGGHTVAEGNGSGLPQ